MGSLRDRLNQDVEGWRPEPGDEVFGNVVSVDQRESDYGDDYPYIEIETEDGNIVGVHGFHTVLKRELARLQPKPGDTLGIKYKGKVTGKRTDAKGKPVEFEAYRVVHESAQSEAPAPDWDSMGAAADGEADFVGADAPGDEEPF